ncbi:hypothetical protein PFISCL1PPCAC_19623, partial [Pristionchus fissidentatus]
TPRGMSHVAQDGREISHKKVFEDVVNNALLTKDNDQAINFACTQLECMYQFTKSTSEVRWMCTLAVDKFYNSKRFRGNEHVLRVFQVLVRISQKMGAPGIYARIEDDGYFRNSFKFHILWGESAAAMKNVAKFKDIWTLARQRIPNKANVDGAFKEVASLEFPEVSSWFDDEEHDKTLNVFASSTKSRRRSVALLERAAIPTVNTLPAPATKTIQLMSKTNPLRRVAIDRDDGYLGISLEEYRVAAADDLADMEITMMHPIEEQPEMEMEEEEKEKEEDVQMKKARIYSPVRQPLAPKQEVVSAPSPLVAHTSFTSNFYNKARDAFSETMKVEEIVTSPIDKQSNATYEVEKTASTTSLSSLTTPTAAHESFAIFIDDDHKEEEKPVVLPPPVVPRPRGLSARQTPVTYDDDLFEDEPTVAGLGRGKKDRFLTSTPAVKGFERESAEDFWNEQPSSGSGMDDLDLSAIDKESGEKKEMKPMETVTMGGGGFARKRKSIAVFAGDKARSSLLPKGAPPPEKEIENALQTMKIGGEEGKINPWDREIRGAIMKQCSIPVNRHDLPGSIKQPRNGQTMELGGEQFTLDKMIGEGGFAKVFLCKNEKNEELAMKYETPSCEWEVYILEALRKRIRNTAVMESLMQVTDAFIYQNCSLILSEYLPMGTLLQSANTNTDPHWSIVVFLGMQMARVLKDVHNANIVHGDAKPDNWMIIEKINEDASIDELLDSRCLRLIDWGRAIDMKALGGRSLYGRAGTEQFDCIEMCEGRPWTYHPDLYAFCATIYVLHTKEYMNVTNTNGRYAPVKGFKRRLSTVSLWSEIFDECFNIPPSSPLPSWDIIYNKLKGYFVENMDKSAWKEAVRKFNKSLLA